MRHLEARQTSFGRGQEREDLRSWIDLRVPCSFGLLPRCFLGLVVRVFDRLIAGVGLSLPPVGFGHERKADRMSRVSLLQLARSGPGFIEPEMVGRRHRLVHQTVGFRIFMEESVGEQEREEKEYSDQGLILTKKSPRLSRGGEWDGGGNLFLLDTTHE